MELTGKTAIVTGGASGIGMAISIRLAEAGAQTIIADVNRDLSNKTVQDIKRKWPDAALYAIETDISNINSINKLVEKTKKYCSRIDILVNNAGILIPRLLVDPKGKEEATEAIWNKMVSINQKGSFFCAQAVAREMIKEKAGVIINVSSESGLEGSEGQSIYAATKAALYSYTRSWAKELGKYNIRVVGIAPGILEATGLRSPEYGRALAYARGITVQQLKESYEKVSIPIGRTGTLKEVAGVVCFLASEEASYITGTVINISGGKSRA